MYGAKPHQHRSLYHAGRESKKTLAGGQGERRRIDIPILPCLLHWPPTLSHIIAADTEKTNDSRVGNMGGEGEGPRRRGFLCAADGTMRGCVADSHRVRNGTYAEMVTGVETDNRGRR